MDAAPGSLQAQVRRRRLRRLFPLGLLLYLAFLPPDAPDYWSVGSLSVDLFVLWVWEMNLCYLPSPIQHSTVALTSHSSCCFSELVHALGKSVAVNDLLPASAAYDSQLLMNCYCQELNVES